MMGEAKTEHEAIKMLNDKNILPIFDKSIIFNESDDEGGDAKIPREPHQKWRRDKYWCEEVDNLFKSHKDLFEKLFEAYSGRHMKPGENPRYCHVDEFE